MDQPAHAKIQVGDEDANLLGEQTVTILPHRTSLVDLTDIEKSSGPQGSVRIIYDGPNNGLVINGELEDPAVGYSTHLPLHFPPVGSAQHAVLSTAALGLMTGPADPMMSFPKGTIFTPYSVVRNISDQPITVTPTLWWMEDNAPRSARLSAITLRPYQTANLNVPDLLLKAGVKSAAADFNLVLDTDGKSRALLFAAGSLDQTYTYVFEVTPMAVMESVSKSISYWSTGDGDDTMVTLWNPADEPQDFVFMLRFAGGNHYSWPVHLEARGTKNFNISEILHDGKPDAEGNVIPQGVHEGNAVNGGTRGK
jgi:hypothetical protein